MDMTNSFFQTCVHPNDIHLTAITTPLGMAGHAYGTQKFSAHTPTMNGSCTAAFDWENLSHVLGRYCHLVQLCHRTCKAHRHGYGCSSGHETTFKSKEMCLFPC